MLCGLGERSIKLKSPLKQLDFHSLGRKSEPKRMKCDESHSRGTQAGLGNGGCVRKRDLRFFALYRRSARNGKQGKCGHTCYFLVPLALRKCLLGSSPNPLDFGTKCPKAPALCACCLRPGLPLRGLIFPSVYVLKNVDNISDKRGRAYKHIGVSLFTIKKCWY